MNLDNSYRFGASVPIEDFDLETVDRTQRDLQARIERMFHDAHGFYWKLTQWPDTDGRLLHVSWLSHTVPWSHRCRFQCPLENGGML